jgi:hypothetical protein
MVSCMTLFSLFGIHLLGQIPRTVITNTKDMIIFVVSMYIAKISSHLLKKKKILEHFSNHLNTGVLSRWLHLLMWASQYLSRLG